MTDLVKPLLFRVDAGPAIGTGHVMRCLSLAQQWHDGGGRSVFALAGAPPAVADRVRAAGATVAVVGSPPGSADDAEETALRADDIGAEWVVVDGYHFSADFQRTLKGHGKRVLAIDDYGHCSHYAADLVLNQNLYASDRLYPSRDEACRLLLGARYLLLRREFDDRRGAYQGVPETARRWLVTLGGADPDNVTRKVLDALGRLPEGAFEATVVVGPTNPHRESIEAAARSIPGVRVLPQVNDMPGLMAANDLAVTAGGTTTWESGFMGLPALQVVVADNQREVARSSEAAGFALNLGWHEAVTPEVLACEIESLARDAARRGRMALAGRSLFDADGPARVCLFLEGARLRLRRVRTEDAELLWDWANEPGVRSRGFHTAPIPWDDHVRWLANKLQSPDAFLFLGVDGADRLVGQVRLDRSSPDEAIISISVAKDRRGEGWGTDLIKTATDWGFRRLGLSRINALIKPDNAASRRAFEKADYAGGGCEWIDGTEAVRATRERAAVSFSGKGRR